MHRLSLSRLVSPPTLLSPTLRHLYLRRKSVLLLRLEAAQLKLWRHQKPRKALSKLTSRMIRTNTFVPAVMKFPKFKKTNLLEKLSWQLLPHLCSLTHKWEKPLHLTRLIITKLRISTEHLILNQKVRMSKLLTYFQMVLIQSMTGYQSSLKSK